MADSGYRGTPLNRPLLLQLMGKVRMEAPQFELKICESRYRLAGGIGRRIVGAIALAVTIACVRQASIEATLGIDPAGERKLQLFVLPADFQGPVMVIYDQPGGVRPKAVKGQIVYDVPGDGIVRTALPEEVLAGSQVKFVYRSRAALPQYHTCTQMRLQGLASDPAAVCWLAIQVGGNGMPDHAVYIITDWAGIPQNYNRGARMLDSLFFGGPGGPSSSKFKWQEPAPPPAGKSA